jgi:amidase
VNVAANVAVQLEEITRQMGKPVGVQFAARFGDEATLFRLASQLEQARPWAGRIP